MGFEKPLRKQSGGHFFSPWENPWKADGIPQGGAGGFLSFDAFPDRAPATPYNSSLREEFGSMSKNHVIPSHCARRRVQSATAEGGS